MSNSRNRSQGEIEFEVKSRIGILQTYSTGWTKELNIIAWNGGTAKYDIRDWNPEHTSMSRGITLHEEEAVNLMKLLNERLGKTRFNGSGWDTAENADAIEKERQQAISQVAEKTDVNESEEAEETATTATQLYEEEELCEEATEESAEEMKKEA